MGRRGEKANLNGEETGIRDMHINCSSLTLNTDLTSGPPCLLPSRSPFARARH